jgi:hypothetical protein
MEHINQKLLEKEQCLKDVDFIYIFITKNNNNKIYFYSFKLNLLTI